METSTSETKLKQSYNSLPKNKILEVRDSIIKECGITLNIWYNWVEGKTPVPKLCRIVIATHFQKSEFDLFEKIK